MTDKETAQLRNYSGANVEAGRVLIAAMGLCPNVTFKKGEAFDDAGLAALHPRPIIAVVSSLYELFPDNDQVCESLRGA